MKTHDEFWNVAHQIVKPVVNARQNVDWFIAVPKNKVGVINYNMPLRSDNLSKPQRYFGNSGKSKKKKSLT